VFYANVFMARAIGTALYEAISYAPTYWLLGERFFAHAAYGTRRLTTDALDRLQTPETLECRIDRTALQTVATRAEHIAEEIAAVIAASGYPIVGFTTTFEQTASSIAIAHRLKLLRPQTLAILGGANCDGAMAAGVLSLSSAIDYVFSGESETTFPEFLTAWRCGNLPARRVIGCDRPQRLDDLPPPNYQDYYEQLRLFLPQLAESGDVWLPYESSRGCWWGAKHHCTFCGLNAQTMTHRQKPGAQALAELQALLTDHPSRKVSMVDNIMPHDYFKTFLPDVRRVLGDVHIFYEQKANLSLQQVLALKDAGVHVIQPGIESLSTSVLKLIDKGVSLRKNLELLRFARSADVALNWNYLIGFPGDRAEDYWRVVEMIPWLVHLCPPSGLSGLSIDRFSPYFERPEHYGVRNMQPMESYFDVLPSWADTSNIAYHFVADYDSGSRADGELHSALKTAIDRWRGLWNQDSTAPPTLSVHPVDDNDRDLYLLLDSRFDLSQPTIAFLDGRQMCVVLTGAHLDDDSEILAWAREGHYLVEADGYWVPLATSDRDTLTAALSMKRSGPASVSISEAGPDAIAHVNDAPRDLSSAIKLTVL
jgi:ribosomal peptide maturation radical SAM protein 1